MSAIAKLCSDLQRQTVLTRPPGEVSLVQVTGLAGLARRKGADTAGFQASTLLTGRFEGAGTGSTAEEITGSGARGKASPA